MKHFPKAASSHNEANRLKVLKTYHIIESGQDENFDELAKLASYICETPISLISFIDEDRQYNKSCIGIQSDSQPREDGFCQYTILQSDILEVKDLSESDVFKFNPLVKEDPNFRFYAGMPLSTEEGYTLGALCVMDTKAKQLNDQQKDALRAIAKQVMKLLELRKHHINFKKDEETLLEETNRDINKKPDVKEQEFGELTKHLDKSIATVKIDLKGRIISANKRYCDIMEYEQNELIGQNHSILVPEFEETYKQYLKKIGRGVFHREKAMRITKNGNEKWIEANYNPIFDEQENLVYILNIAYDITNQVQNQKKYELAKLEAKKAFLAKDNFLSNMSHEMRTPLNAIIGFSEILKREKLNRTQIGHVNNISNAGDDLLSIINDILDLSKIESGEFFLENIPFSPAEVLKTVDEAFRTTAFEKKITLEAEIDDILPKLVVGDKSRFSQILTNLVNNAIKFTHKGFVKVSASAELLKNEDCMLTVKVQDSGIGIPEDKQQVIFQRFAQADYDTSKKFGGTGLGLNIVKLLVENFKGTLSVNSKFGEGSTFTVSIPFKIGLESELIEQSEVNSEHEFIPGKILLFEDNPLNQKLGQKILSDLGHELTIVSNGVEGVEWLKQNKADLILMDLRMPEMDGYEATSIIKKELKLNTPIIAMTAHTLNQEKARCLDYGMNDFLAKPFKLDELSHKIQTALLGKKPVPNSTSGSVKGITDKLYDLEELELLASGNEAFVKEMSDVFMEETPEELLIIQNGILNEDFETIYQTSHKLKSSYDAIGYKNTFLLKSIEELCKKEESVESIESIFKRLKSETADIIADLKENLSKRSYS